MIRPVARIARFSLSGLYSQIEPFSDCPARAAAACSRRSGRYCVSLVSVKTTLTGCPKAPPARREGSSGLFSMNGIVFRLPANAIRDKRMIRPAARIVRLSLSGLYSQIEPFSDCPARAASACSRRSGRYCVSLMSLEASLTGCPRQSRDGFASPADKHKLTTQHLFEVIPFGRGARRHRLPGVRAVPDCPR